MGEWLAILGRVSFCVLGLEFAVQCAVCSVGISTLDIAGEFLDRYLGR